MHRPRLQRFFGFKTNMGMDGYPHPRFGFNNLFEPSENPFSSDVLNGPCLVQGVYIPDDVGLMYEDDPLLRKLVDGKLKTMKGKTPDYF